MQLEVVVRTLHCLGTCRPRRQPCHRPLDRPVYEKQLKVAITHWLPVAATDYTVLLWLMHDGVNACFSGNVLNTRLVLDVHMSAMCCRSSFSDFYRAMLCIALHGTSCSVPFILANSCSADPLPWSTVPLPSRSRKAQSRSYPAPADVSPVPVPIPRTYFLIPTNSRFVMYVVGYVSQPV